MFNLINVTRIANANVEKGKIAGIFAMFTVLGSIIGPVIGGFAGEYFGIQAVFLIFIPLYLGLALKLSFKHHPQPSSQKGDHLSTVSIKKESSDVFQEV